MTRVPGPAQENAFVKVCPAGLRPLPDCCSMVYDVPYGVFRSNAAGRFVEVNPALVRMLGYDSAEELCSVDLATWVYADPADRQRLLDEGPDYLSGLELAWKRKDGSPITVRLSGRRHRGPGGGPEEFTGIIEDITEQKRAEEELRRSEDRYRLIADNVTDMIWTAVIDGLDELLARAAAGDTAGIGEELARRWRFTYVSPSSERMLGYSPEEVIGLGLRGILSPDGYRETRRVLAEELTAEAGPSGPGRRPQLLEASHRTKAGGSRWCEVQPAFVRDARGRIEAVLGVTRDVTERREAEEALRASEAALRGLVANMPDFVIVVGPDSTIQFANRGAPGARVEDLVGRSGFGYIRPEFRAACEESLRRAIETRAPQAVECVDVFDAVWSCRVVPLELDGEVQSAIVICTDVTEQRRAEAAVRQEQDLLRRLLEVHERDRQLLAFELHDGFAQQLTGALLNFEAAAQAEGTDLERARAARCMGLRLLRESIEESRRVVAGLGPPVLEEFGIIAAIEHLAETHQSDGGPEIAVVSKGPFGRLAAPLENAVFRIVQETLANACRHSRSDRVRVELGCDAGQLHVCVEDWGVGFDPRKVDERHFGLRGVRERARLLGGQAVIDTWPGGGTRVAVRLPALPREPEPAPLPDPLESPPSGAASFGEGM